MSCCGSLVRSVRAAAAIAMGGCTTARQSGVYKRQTIQHVRRVFIVEYQEAITQISTRGTAPSHSAAATRAHPQETNTRPIMTPSSHFSLPSNNTISIRRCAYRGYPSRSRTTLQNDACGVTCSAAPAPLSVASHSAQKALFRTQACCLLGLDLRCPLGVL